MQTVLVEFEKDGRPPTFAEAALILGVDAEALDPSFGVVLIEPDRNTFAVLARADRVPATGGPFNVRLFVNPSIASSGRTPGGRPEGE